MSANRRDIGAFLEGAFAIPNTAQGATNESEISGASVDREALGDLGHSVALLIPVQATLQSGTTLAVAANLQDSANDSDWTDYGDALASTVVLTGPSGGGEVQGAAKLGVNLSGARRYVRAQVLIAYSATGTDTGLFAGVFAFGGQQSLPAA